ncbi:hypothetical protein BDQ94DRAFT_135277 [Aspergillus welwitschiae]|uniref:Uncharacterized protein n=1 Tax=Aspergillus welwitschiae TaxID=1341132 RepID=A0A3F3QFM1_9EURO|nr:hypothetical protein BDQ94DRAFT_135277 [Aspergillus welwitschiae]RDH37905.1 hypothetical protein BDQ94DRAFT_135277 [Aspergillus welwitschiae]
MISTKSLPFARNTSETCASRHGIRVTLHQPPPIIPPNNIPNPNYMPRVQMKPSEQCYQAWKIMSSGTDTRYVLSDVFQCVATEKKTSRLVKYTDQM